MNRPLRPERRETGARPSWQRLEKHEVVVGPGLPLTWRCPPGQQTTSPDLVFIPGIGSDGRAWYRQSPLSERGSVAFFDNPIRIDGAPYTFDILALLLRDAVYQMCDRPPVLVGSSFGGMVALTYAVTWPDALSGLVISSASADARWFPYPFELGYQLLRWVPDRWFEQTFPTFCRLSGWRDGQDAEVRDLFSDQGRQFSSRPYANRIRAIGALRLEDQLSAVRVPTLVMHGTADQSIPARMGRAIAQRIPDATLRLAQGGTHNIHLNRPLWFNTQVTNWLQTHHLGG